jgi:uncharacterized membrane protein YbhN (UPF0104 family)
MLQELRVMQTGAQLIAGFLLTLPFQQRFEEITDRQQHAYLALVVLATLVTAVVMTPIAIHRRLAGRHVKQRLVAAGRVALQVVLALLGLLLVGTTSFVFSVVSSTTAAVVVAACLAVLLLSLLVALPYRLVD